MDKQDIDSIDFDYLHDLQYLFVFGKVCQFIGLCLYTPIFTRREFMEPGGGSRYLPSLVKKFS